MQAMDLVRTLMSIFVDEGKAVSVMDTNNFAASITQLENLICNLEGDKIGEMLPCPSSETPCSDTDVNVEMLPCPPSPCTPDSDDQAELQEPGSVLPPAVEDGELKFAQTLAAFVGSGSSKNQLDILAPL